MNYHYSFLLNAFVNPVLGNSSWIGTLYTGSKWPFSVSTVPQHCLSWFSASPVSFHVAEPALTMATNHVFFTWTFFPSVNMLVIALSLSLVNDSIFRFCLIVVLRPIIRLLSTHTPLLSCSRHHMLSSFLTPTAILCRFFFHVTSKYVICKGLCGLFHCLSSSCRRSPCRTTVFSSFSMVTIFFLRRSRLSALSNVSIIMSVYYYAHNTTVCTCCLPCSLTLRLPLLIEHDISIKNFSSIK